MAKIVHSDLAPDEVVHYSFAGVEFDLGGSAGKAYETTDRVVLGNAESHPWLTVEYDKVELIGGEPRTSLADRPGDDAMSISGPNASVPFDPEEIAKVEGAKVAVTESHTALDADLDQGEESVLPAADGGEIAQTVESDDTHEAAKSVKAFDVSDEQAAQAAAGTLDPADEVDPTTPASRSTRRKASTDKESD